MRKLSEIEKVPSISPPHTLVKMSENKPRGLYSGLYGIIIAIFAFRIKREFFRAHRLVDFTQSDPIRELQWRLVIQEKRVFAEHDDYIQLIAHAKSSSAHLTW